MRRGLRFQSLRHERRREAAVRLGVGRVDLQGVPVLDDGRIHLPLSRKSPAQVVVRVRETRIAGQRRTVRRSGFHELPLLLLRDPEPVLRLDELRLHPQG